MTELLSTIAVLQFLGITILIPPALGLGWLLVLGALSLYNYTVYWFTPPRGDLSYKK